MKIIHIDFHIHTISVNGKDGPFTFNQDWLDKYINTAQLDAIAITNHNKFNKSQFNSISDKTNINVYPGMELSLGDGHANIILDSTDANIDMLADFSNNITAQFGPNDSMDIDDFIDYFDEFKENIIIIYESGNKSQCISGRYINKLKNAEYTTVPAVSNKKQFNQNKSNHISSVLFSDAHASKDDQDTDRTNINNLISKSTYIQVPDEYIFNDIRNNIKCYQLVDLDKSKLNHEDIIDIDYYDEDDKKFDTKHIKIIDGINLITGDRGSGKTTLLQNLNRHYKKANKSVEYLKQFSNIQTANKFIKQQCAQEEETLYNRLNSKYSNIFNNIYNFIKNIDDSPENKLDDCIKSAKEYYKLANQKQYIERVSWYGDSFNLEPLSQNIESIKQGINDLQSLKSNHNFWKNFTEIDYSLVQLHIGDFISKAKEILKNKAIEYTIKEKINIMLDSIKNKFSQKNGLNSPDHFHNELFKNIKIEQTKKYINDWISKFINCYDQKKYEQDFISEYLIISSYNKYSNITSLRDQLPKKNIQKEIDGDMPSKIFKTTYSKGDYITYLYKFKDYINSPNDIIQLLISINSDIYTAYKKKASGGQRIGLSLLINLNRLESTNPDIILIDEPESSLDNTYINNHLSKQILKLSEKSTVFISTHNSTLGKILQNNQLIYTEYSQNKYNVYSGNYLDKKLYDYDRMDSMYKKFLNSMEGGESGYKGKVDIYEYLEK